MNQLIQRANHVQVQLEQGLNWDKFYAPLCREIDAIRSELDRIPMPTSRVIRSLNSNFYIGLLTLGIEDLLQHQSNTERVEQFEKEKREYISNKISLLKILNESTRKLQKKAEEYFQNELKDDDVKTNPFIMEMEEQHKLEIDFTYDRIQKHKEEVSSHKEIFKILQDQIQNNEKHYSNHDKTKNLNALKQKFKLGFESKNPCKIDKGCLYNTELEIYNFLKDRFNKTLDFFNKNINQSFNIEINTIKKSFYDQFTSFDFNSTKKITLTIPLGTIIFNDSEQLRYPGYEENLKTIYNFMALRTIHFSEIKTLGTAHILCDGIRIYPSQVNKVLSATKQENSDSLQFTPIYNPQNIQGLTPHEQPQLSIEPVECFRIYNTLSDEEKKLLHILILAPLIPDEKKILKDALNDYSKLIFEQSKKIKLLISYINDFAVCFSSHPVCQNLLTEFAVNDNEKVLPLKKTSPFTLPPVKDSFDEWIFDREILGSKLFEIMEDQKKKISPFWENISPEMLQVAYSGTYSTLSNSDSEAYKTLDKQYHILHTMISYQTTGNGCLLSSLTRALIPISISQPKAVHLIREAMAKHVEINRNKYTQKIRSQWNLSLESYVKRLRYQERNGYIYSNIENQLSELEIEICANTFGISIEVFINGGQYRIEKGLMTPSLQFGPKTKQKIILFNKTGYTYYALFPKIKCPSTISNGELKDSILSLNNGWKNHNKDVSYGYS